MKRTLVLAEPIIFKSSTHALIKYPLYALLAYVIGLNVVGIVRLALAPESILGVFFIAGGAFLLHRSIDHFEKRVSIDKDGIEVTSPFGRRRVEWDSQLKFSTVKDRQGFRHVLTNGKDTVKFGDGFINYPYLVKVIEAVVALRGDFDFGIKPPTPPARPIYSLKNLTILTFFGIIAIVIGALLGFGSYDIPKIGAAGLACVGFVYLIMAIVEFKTIKSKGTID